MSDQPAESTTDLARIQVPAVVDLDIIKATLGPSIDGVIARADKTAAVLAAGIKDDETVALAVAAAERLRDDSKDLLEKWREEFYVPRYRATEEVRELFDPRLKKTAALMKTLLGHVSDYKVRKEREARLAQERAEAEARRQREEAAQKLRDAEAAEARAKQAVEDEKRRKLEAEAAEQRRILAEKEAQERRDREARENAAAETARKLKEEEDARLEHAKVAHDEGSGAAKTDTILESATPISPVLGKAEQARSQEAVALEQEQARRVADEKAEIERKASAEAEQRRKDAEAEAFRLRQEAERATAAATASAAAAAAVVEEKSDTGTTGYRSYKWDLESDGSEQGDIAAVMAILKAILDGIYPIEFCGYNRKRPQDFRPSAITDDVSEKEERFVGGHGIRAFLQTDDRLKRRVGGRR